LFLGALFASGAYVQTEFDVDLNRDTVTVQASLQRRHPRDPPPRAVTLHGGAL